VKIAVRNPIRWARGPVKSRDSDGESAHQIQEKYQTLVNNLSVGVYRTTPGSKGRFLEANPAMLQMFEARSKDELLKHNVNDMYQNPEDRKIFSQKLEKDGYVKNEELGLVTLAGNNFIASVTAVTKTDQHGDTYFDGIIENISGFKRVESALRQAHALLETRVKDKTIELEDLIKDLSADIAEQKKLEKRSTVYNQELENTKQAMVNVWDDLNNEKVKLQEGKVRDDAMLESIGEGIIFIDTNGRIVLVNKAAEEMIHSKASEIIGKRIDLIVPLVDETDSVIPFKQQPIHDALSGKKKIFGVYYFLPKGKNKISVSLTVTPVLLQNEIIGAIEVFRDITREREIDRAKTEFVSLASHQLRTPLGIAKWYLEAVEKTGYMEKAPEEIRDYIKQVYESNERVLSLVRDLLSVSRIDQGRIKDNPKSTNIVHLVEGVIKELSIMATKKGVQLDLLAKSRSLPTMSIDSLRLHEVIENLITNALEYTPTGGTVKVVIDKDGNEFRVSVRDNGIGISQEDQKKLFTKFFRSERGLTSNADGSGLGLYVVKSYVENWGGKVMVASKEGRGSTFTIKIPLNNVKAKEVG